MIWVNIVTTMLLMSNLHKIVYDIMIYINDISMILNKNVGLIRVLETKT